MDFVSYLSKFDIVSLVETWMENPTDISNVFHDHEVYMCPAFKSLRGGRNMGGVAVLLKNTLACKTVRICESFRFGVVLKFDSSLFKTDGKSCILLSTYIPPDGSPIHARVDRPIFEILENEILLNDNVTGESEIIMCGDFNARTGELLEFDNDTTVIPELEEFSEILQPISMLPRKSADKTVNRLGKYFIDLLKTYSLYIVNGRMGDDCNKGDFTFIDSIGSSVIDYFVCTASLLNTISNFVVDMNGDLKHLPLCLTINSNQTNQGENISGTTEYVKYFYASSNDDKQSYREIISQSIYDGNFDMFDEQLNDINCEIDTIVESFENLILQCSNPFKKSVSTSKKQNKKNKWFDKECMKVKRERNRLLRVFRQTKLPIDLEKYMCAKKNLNKLISDKKLKLSNETRESIEQSVSDPKLFWTKLKNITNASNNQPNISIDKWYEHFHSLFNDIHIEGEPDFNLGNITTTDLPEIEDTLFNGEITRTEIDEAVKEINIDKSVIWTTGFKASCVQYRLTHALHHKAV